MSDTVGGPIVGSRLRILLITGALTKLAGMNISAPTSVATAAAVASNNSSTTRPIVLCGHEHALLGSNEYSRRVKMLEQLDKTAETDEELQLPALLDDCGCDKTLAKIMMVNRSKHRL
jgi:hypothetical protein